MLLSMCERFKILDPTVIDIDIKQLKEVYLWNQEMLDMNDICQQLARIILLLTSLQDALLL